MDGALQRPLWRTNNERMSAKSGRASPKTTLAVAEGRAAALQMHGAERLLNLQVHNHNVLRKDKQHHMLGMRAEHHLAELLCLGIQSAGSKGNSG